MSARSKSETKKGSAPGPTLEEQRTAIFESGKHARPSVTQHETIDVDPTLVEGPNAGPTLIDGHAAPTSIETPRPPIIAVSKKDAPPPIQAISMKTPGQGLEAPTGATPAMPRPKLRALADVTPPSKATGPVQNFGNLAQPYDPKQARARAVREYVIYGCLAVILASGIALVVWFVAR
jgi:hypothetical protein